VSFRRYVTYGLVALAVELAVLVLVIRYGPQ
jgi:hypothetical protein